MKSSKAKHVPPFLGGFRIPRIDAAATSTLLNKYLERFAASGVNSVGLHLGAMLAFAVERKGEAGREVDLKIYTGADQGGQARRTVLLVP